MNHYVVHLKPMLYANYTSIKEKNGYIILYRKHTSTNFILEILKGIW